MIATTPKPPYYAVIFSAITKDELSGYAETSARMRELAEQIDGFLGVESVGEKEEITVSYWRDLESIDQWRKNTEHMMAKEKGRREWYKSFVSRIAKVESERRFELK